MNTTISSIEFLIGLLFIPKNFKEFNLVETSVETSLLSQGIHEMSSVQTLIELLFLPKNLKDINLVET